MDPVSLFVNIIELATICERSYEVVHFYVHAYNNAPEQLHEFASKLQSFSALLKQICYLVQELDFNDVDIDFAPEQRGRILPHLAAAKGALAGIYHNYEASAEAPSALALSFKSKIRWAAVDQRRVRDGFNLIRDLEDELRGILAVLGV
jgi:hypothetical protein